MRLYVSCFPLNLVSSINFGSFALSGWPSTPVRGMVKEVIRERTSSNDMSHARETISQKKILVESTRMAEINNRSCNEVESQEVSEVVSFSAVVRFLNYQSVS